MKKAIKVLAGLIIVLVVALAAVPLFVNVDQFRPEIVKAVNRQLNGSFELGKLGLSLWGRIHVSIDGLAVKDRSGKEVLSVKDAAFDIPFVSVFTGSPLITLSMKQPQIQVLKNKAGQMNVMTLIQGLPASTPAQASSTQEAGTPAEIQLPALVVNARIGVSVVDAKLTYVDEALTLTNTIERLNLRIHDFSLSRPTEMELWADLKTRMGKGAEGTRVEGPLKLTATLTPEVSGGEFKSAKVDTTLTADDLEIQQGVLFYKTKGVPFHFKFVGALHSNSLNLERATLRFHNAEITVKGRFAQDTGADFSFEAQPIELKSWSALVPMLQEYELEGKLGLQGAVQGQPSSLQYRAKLSIDALTMKGPMLKAKPILNGSISVVTDKIESFLLTLQAPGNDLTLDGKLVSFSAPQLTFAIKSKAMDLDQWVEFPKPSERVASEAAQNKETASAGKAPNSADYDALLEPVRTNPVAKAMVIDGKVSLGYVKAMNVRLDDVQAKLQMKNLVAALTNLKFKMYDGTVSGSFTSDLKPKEPAYTMQLAVSGFDMQKALESQFQSFKNTLIGKLNTSISGGGTSFNPEQIKKKLQIKGEFSMLNAAFKTMDIAKMASEAVNKSINKIGEKVPALSGKNVQLPSQGESRYEVVSSSFTLSGGILEAPNFVAKAAQKRGVDIKGYTKMGLMDESLDAKWELIDTQKVLGAHQISAAVGGKTIPNILAKAENDPVILPVSVGCKWSAPCTNYAQVPEYLAGVAAGRIAKAAGDVAKAKAQDAIQNAIQKAAGDKAGEAVKKGLKSLFGN